jgi:hypothetical protein
MNYEDTWLFRDCYYVKLWSLVTSQTSPQQDLREKLLSAAQGRPIVVDAVTDPTDPGFVAELLSRHNIIDVTTVLINDKTFALSRQQPNFKWFPIWILKAITASLAPGYTPPAQLWSLRTHRVSCLNRIPKHHRLYTFYLLNQQSWFREVYLSFGGFDPLNDSQTPYQEYFSFFQEKEIQWFEQHRHEWPIKHDRDYQWIDRLGQHDPFTPAYRDCYANIATETEVMGFCPTEKTTKCLRTGLLLFAVAAQGHMQGIRDMGFDIDYQGIDSGYDSVVDWRERIQACVAEVDRVYTDIPDIWQANLARLQYNSELFLSTEFANSLLTDVQDIIASPYPET